MKNRVPVIKWSNPRSMGDVPSKRSGHSLTTATGGMAYLFGGVSSSTNRNNNRNSSDVDVLDDITNTTNNEASLLEQKIKKRRRARSSPMNDIFRLDLSGGQEVSICIGVRSSLRQPTIHYRNPDGSTLLITWRAVTI